jgi:predicted metal-dependent hydrolase
MSTHEAAIQVRKPELAFERDIPHVYLDDNVVKTHFFNALNLLFPDGERFFVKAVHDHAERIEDPKLAAEIRAFSGQEGQHARQHERFFAVLERQGYRIAPMLARFHRLARWANVRLPKSLRLSMTAGAEHYTAVLAALVFELRLVERCDPTMRELIEWHALEEIEHKHVAYDVFTSCYRWAYPLRILGFLMATAVIAIWTPLVLRKLLLKDGREGRLTRVQYQAALRALRGEKEQRFRRAMRRNLLGYFRPGFHPLQHDDLPLLERMRPEIDARMAQVSSLVAIRASS